MYAPLLIGGLAATLAGTGMQIAGNQQSKSALSNARAQEVQQQQAFQQKAQAQVNQSLPQSTSQNEQGQINQGAAQRYNAFKQLQSAVSPNSMPAAASSPTADANSPTAQAASRAASTGGAWSDLQAQAQGQMGGIGDMQNQQNIKNALTMGSLGEIGTAAADQASIYPLEQQVALQKGDPLNGWGSLLSSLGSLSMMAGATASAKPASVVAGSNPALQAPVYNPWNMLNNRLSTIPPTY